MTTILKNPRTVDSIKRDYKSYLLHERLQREADMHNLNNKHTKKSTILA